MTRRRCLPGPPTWYRLAYKPLSSGFDDDERRHCAEEHIGWMAADAADPAGMSGRGVSNVGVFGRTSWETKP